MIVPAYGTHSPGAQHALPSVEESEFMVLTSADVYSDRL